MTLSPAREALSLVATSRSGSPAIRLKFFKGDCRRRSRHRARPLSTDMRAAQRPGYHSARAEPALTSLMSTLWSGRFDCGAGPEVFDYGKSLASIVASSTTTSPAASAWAEALAAPGSSTAADAPPSSAAWRRSGSPCTPIRRLIECAADEDVHSFVERELIERIGDAGRRLHTGRSRNEQVSLDFRLYSASVGFPRSSARSRGWSTRSRIRRSRPATAVMPSYTHLRRAQPVLVAHVWLSHAAAFRRDVDRSTRRADEADVHAARIGRDRRHGLRHRRRVARRAASASPASSPNSIDTSGDRDFVASFLFACSMAMVHLSRLAEDVILFSTEEFGFFEIHDSVATGSSLMPQKKNPDPLELVRGKSGKAVGIADRLADVDEGPAARLQQGSAGGQGGWRSRRRICDRVRADDRDGQFGR